MGIKMWNQMIVVVGMLMCLASAALAEQGTATFYKQPYTPSACFGQQDNGVLIAGASDQIWNARKACGTRYRVKCIGGANTAPHPCKDGTSVDVKIVDYCQSCNGTINLSDVAFSKIASLEAGKIRVEYDR
ncbi:hypothetical protein FEM48_Zijuj01G0073700 [Ziziphus jujuba var. spinosa]|uniref:Expansin-like EG45 domain-containing protein n=1 Tax=Ziziphus jujuba var. spinosa TaxID=714518 RepID=A0A978VZW5_ZIZJJ|nr:hypothetical protein FEM48_Zijuj01G0073700 [Ziziphus jujuba var. spinosa]